MPGKKKTKRSASDARQNGGVVLAKGKAAPKIRPVGSSSPKLWRCKVEFAMLRGMRYSRGDTIMVSDKMMTDHPKIAEIFEPVETKVETIISSPVKALSKGD